MIITALKDLQVREEYLESEGTKTLQSARAIEEGQFLNQGASSLESMERKKVSYFLEFQKELFANDRRELLLGDILQKFIGYLEAESGSILLTDENGTLVGGKICYKGNIEDRSAEDLKAIGEDSLASWIVKNRMPTIVENTTEDPRWRVCRDEESSHTAIASPIIRKGKMAGILLLKRLHARKYTQDDIRILAGLVLLLSMHGIGLDSLDAVSEDISDLPRAE
jgi:transcriptional regulator with GAF, ATPase, and Fis domain